MTSDIIEAPGDDGPPPGTRVMAAVRWLLVAVMAAAAVAALAYYFGWFRSAAPGPAATPGAPAPPPAPSAPAVPGLAPIDLSPERIQLTGLRTATATRAAVAADIHTVGFVTANEKGLAQVQTRISGWLERVFVAQTGERVQKGQVVALIYSPDLLAAQEELLNAQRWEQHPADGLATGLRGDARTRLEVLGVAKEDIATIEKTGKPIRDFQIRAPAAGYVTQKNAVEGLFVQPGTMLYQLADLSTIWVLADVYEHELDRVRAGATATILLAAFPGERFPGKVTFLYPTVDPATRTLRVRIELKNPGLRLRPGMYANVEIGTASTEGIFVPSEAIVDTGELQVAFIAGANGRFEPRRVRLGARAGDRVQVLSGVAEGEVVVTTANFLIDSESRLRAAIAGDGSGGGGGGAPGSDECAALIDRAKFPDKYQQCLGCRVHRGMGTMEQDCHAAIPKPWK